MKVSSFTRFLVWFCLGIIVFQNQVFAAEQHDSVKEHSFKLPFTSRIEGRVFDQNHNPIPDVFVELLNEVESLVARTKTDASGRFTFTNTSTGRFLVKVVPYGKNLMPDSQSVEVTALRTGASSVAYVDFYLRPEKRNNDFLEGERPEAIFAQEIPPEAQKLFDNGVKDLEKNKDEGLAKIEAALNIFPTYFNALNRLGKEYVLRKNYEKAYPYLLKSIDINARSFSSYYTLGFAFYQLKQIPAALEAAKACLVLDASSINGNLLYGTLLRLKGSYQEAEKTLLTANSLSKGKTPDVHMQLALLYNRLNRNQEAITELETYLKLEPNSTDRKNIEETIAKLKGTVSKNK